MQQIAITMQHIGDLSTILQYCIIDEYGGIIGSDSTSSLCIEDEKVHPQHASIQYEEGCFSIASIGNSDIFYNNSFSKLVAGYETIMELGDNFRIGDYQFNVIHTDDLQKEFLDVKKIIKDTKPYNMLDNMDIKPRGQISGMDIDTDTIDTILSHKTYIDSVFQDIYKRNDELDSVSINADDLKQPSVKHGNNIPQDTHIINMDYTKNHQVHITARDISALINDLFQQLPPCSTIPTHLDFCADIDSEELKNHLITTPLVTSPLLTNLLILSLVIREFDNPLLEILDQDILSTTLTHAIMQQKQGEYQELYCLLYKALQSYLAK